MLENFALAKKKINFPKFSIVCLKRVYLHPLIEKNRLAY